LKHFNCCPSQDILGHELSFRKYVGTSINSPDGDSYDFFQNTDFQKKKKYTTMRQLRIHVGALAVINLTYSRLLSSGAYRIWEYFIFNNNKNNKYTCWIASRVIEVWTPENRSRHYACGVCGNLISLCVQLPCPLPFSVMVLKRRRWKKLYPTPLHGVDPSNFLTRLITTIDSVLVEYHNADRVVLWTWWV